MYEYCISIYNASALRSRTISVITAISYCYCCLDKNNKMRIIPKRTNMWNNDVGERPSDSTVWQHIIAFSMWRFQLELKVRYTYCMWFFHAFMHFTTALGASSLTPHSAHWHWIASVRVQPACMRFETVCVCRDTRRILECFKIRFRCTGVHLIGNTHLLCTPTEIQTISVKWTESMYYTKAYDKHESRLLTFSVLRHTINTTDETCFAIARVRPNCHFLFWRFLRDGEWRLRVLSTSIALLRCCAFNAWPQTSYVNHSRFSQSKRHSFQFMFRCKWRKNFTEMTT